jgi:hypothetical protein
VEFIGGIPAGITTIDQAPLPYPTNETFARSIEVARLQPCSTADCTLRVGHDKKAITLAESHCRESRRSYQLAVVARRNAKCDDLGGKAFVSGGLRRKDRQECLCSWFFTTLQSSCIVVLQL